MGRRDKRRNEALDGVVELVCIDHRWETCQRENAITDCHLRTSTQPVYQVPKESSKSSKHWPWGGGQVWKLLTPSWTPAGG